MKYGINTFLWTAEFTTEHLPLLPKIKEAGFHGVEVSLFDPPRFDATGIRKGLEAFGLDCTVCSVLPGELSLLSDDPEIRCKTEIHLQDCIKATADAGATILAGPLYSPVGYLPGRRRTDDEWRRAVECYQALTPTLNQYGVTLAIEPLNRFETFFLNTAADAARLCDDVNHPNVGILFDTFHANIEEKDIAQAYRSLGKHLMHVHTCENDRGTPGSGHVEWGSVFQALRDLRYDGWLTIESFGSSIARLSAAASIWRDLAAHPDDIAFDGIRFLQSHTA